MRRIARMVAASVVVVLGLALVGVAALGADAPTMRLPKAPSTLGHQRTITPLDPDASDSRADRIDNWDVPDVFNSQFGERGKHDVTVSTSGSSFYYYYVAWRGGKVEQGAGNYQKQSTITGGFPLALVAVNSPHGSASCTVTIDGIQRDHQTTSEKRPIVYCEG